MSDEFTIIEPPKPREPIDLTLKVYSLINWVQFKIRKLRKWSRQNYLEKPAWILHGLSNQTQLKIDSLKNKYQVTFESFLNRGNALENYHLLDILHTLREKWSWTPIAKNRVLDVGSKNFYYAPCFAAFFKPNELLGIELDAYGLYADFHTRYSYAHYYTSLTPNSQYLSGDFCQLEQTADLLTFLYPFVIPEPLVRWELPLTEFKPEKIFEHAFKVLADNGSLFMINQGEEEYAEAKKILSKAGFIKLHSYRFNQTLLERHHPPVASLWVKSTQNIYDHH